VPTDRPTSVSFSRTIDGAAMTVAATFTPHVEEDEHGDGTNDFEAGYDAVLTLTDSGQE
jgi:hypothetical protein